MIHIVHIFDDAGDDDDGCGLHVESSMFLEIYERDVIRTKNGLIENSSQYNDNDDDKYNHSISDDHDVVST